MGSLGSDTTERLHFHFSLSCIGGGNDNPLHSSCLENPRDGGAWWAAVYGVTQSWTRLKRLSSSSSSSPGPTKQYFRSLLPAPGSLCSAACLWIWPSSVPSVSRVIGIFLFVTGCFPYRIVLKVHLCWSTDRNVPPAWGWVMFRFVYVAHFVHPSTDPWVVSASGQLWAVLLRTCCAAVRLSPFFWVGPGVELLDPIEAQGLAIWGTPHCFLEWLLHFTSHQQCTRVLQWSSASLHHVSLYDPKRRQVMPRVIVKGVFWVNGEKLRC